MENFEINIQPEGEGNIITPEEAEKLKRRERKEIFIIGLVTGLCIIVYELLTDLISVPIMLSKTLYNLYVTNPIFTYAFTAFASLFCLMGTFLAGGAFLRKRTKADYRFFNKPDDMFLSVYAVPMGLFACIVGNYLTTIFVEVMKNMGFILTTPDFDTPKTVSGRIAYFIAIAVVPPIAEEISIRGCIMQPLRKYGDRFAIIISAFLFAALHGNLVQAPFALIAGVAFGYITCMTGSLIPSMIVHFLNNLYSVCLEFLTEDVTDTQVISRIYITSELIFISVGVVASIFFAFRLNHRTLRNPVTMLTPAGKAAAFAVNPTVIISIIILLYVASNYISYSPVK